MKKSVILAKVLEGAVAAPVTYSISGTVYDLDGTTAVASATVALGAASTTSAANGTYTITGVAAGASGSMTCTKAGGYVWNPITITAMNANLTNQNYAAMYQVLLEDLFTTNEAAPIVTPRTCEPGPGTLAVRDVESKISITGNALLLDVQATPVSNEEDVVAGSAIARACGLAVYGQLTLSAGGGYFGFVNSATPTYDTNLVDGIRIVSATGIRAHQAANPVTTMGDLVVAASNTYELLIVARTNGTNFFVRGGSYSSWKLWTMATVSTGTNLRAAFSSLSTGAFVLDKLMTMQLAAPYTTQTGLATEGHAGSVSTGQALTHEGDFIANWTMTLPASGSTTIDFRRQDANNYWRLDIASTGAATLYEVVAGTPTSRGTATGINTLGCWLKAVGTSIWFGYNVGNKITYTSAANFQTATAGLVTLGASGTLSDLYLYPYTLSGTAKAILDALNP
jgi:hypothetical protein